MSTGSRTLLAAVVGGALLLGITLLCVDVAWAQPVLPTPPSTTGVSISMSGGSDDVAGVLKLIIMMTILALVPAILMTMTCFTRIVIVFAFLRQAMGTQQTPPNQVLIGLSLFLTLFIMAPTFSEIEQNAYEPYIAGEMSTGEAMDAGSIPLRNFMLRQTRDKDLGLFYQISGRSKPTSVEEVPLMVVAPAFILSELKTAFEIGFLVYVPFLIVDMLIASVLMSMGMMMLPPVVVSLPFKLLLFVMIDGWFLIVGTLIQSFAV
jgi:flagellar biosynthetic protein FliP